MRGVITLERDAICSGKSGPPSLSPCLLSAAARRSAGPSVEKSEKFMAKVRWKNTDAFTLYS